ncbi:MAG: TIGR03668 family PPOX class F420-dependent oxidoreductase, partial [Gammaproteobacteria bacterium]
PAMRPGESRDSPLTISIDDRVEAFIASHRVARLATAGADGKPHVIPICYAFDGFCLYSAIDQKPKRVAGRRLKRTRNIIANPKVALLIDDYSEDWSRLAYVLIQGSAEILEAGEERHRAEAMLRAKYAQYGALLEAGCLVLKIRPERVTGWGRIAEGKE